MKYISKGDEPAVMADFKAQQARAGLPANYDLFGGKGNKAALNAILRAEQGNICCYCQRRIDHYMGDKLSGAHNEHLKPQHLDPGDGSVDLAYNNIFACCIASRGLKNKGKDRLTHCGEAKGKLEICGSILYPDCEDRFAYNLSGEILPAGAYGTWKECEDNYDGLSPALKLLVDELRVLNLNCPSLKDERRKTITALCLWAAGVGPGAIPPKLRELEEADELAVFHSAVKYFMKLLSAHRPA